MNRYVQIAELVVAILLILAILLQQRGAGLGGIFGGEGNVYRTKRGLEKGLYIGTIILVVLFFGLAIANLLLQ